ncbi:bifunctional diaminohydroxyphosphoribosylaminopyrimidine deaminase/5-amino-6-(5-phosphoribosylamino)uracil reductase RibD [Candidatus Neomarinimicrobiota bacterium]
MNETDIYYMNHALELARRGIGRVSPNPAVGAVLVSGATIIGEGYHAQFGGDHAEVMAIKSGHGATSGATLYVTLEPCSITGKTPPCTDAVIEAGVARVVIATLDPNPHVKGNGAKKLRDAGIAVDIGVEAARGARLIRGFSKWIVDKLPFVTLKIARTRDNFVLQSLENKKWFTSDQSRKRVHELRAEHDAVLVGSNTVEEDNPALTVREIEGINPIRVVLDTDNRLTEDHKVFSDLAAATLRFSSQGTPGKQQWGEHFVVPRSDSGLSLAAVMDVLGKRGVTSVLIEGGPLLQRACFDGGYADEIAIFTSPHNAEAGVIQKGNLENTVLIPVDWEQIEYGATGLDNFQLAAKSKKGA